MGFKAEEITTLENIESPTFNNEVLPEILERAQKITNERVAIKAADRDCTNFQSSLQSLAKEIFSGKKHEYTVAAGIHLGEVANMPFSEAASMLRNQAEATANWFKRQISGESAKEGKEISEELSKKLAERQAILDKFIEDTQADPEAMYRALFDVEPVGKITFERDPISIVLYLEKQEDYENVSLVDKKNNKIRFAPKNSSAINITGTRDESLNGAIIAVSMEKARELPQSLDSLIDHEKQHALRQFLESDRIKEIKNIFDVIDEIGVISIVGQVEQREKALFGRDFLRFLADLSIEYNVKDEILAYYRCGVPVEYTKAMLRADSVDAYYDFDRLQIINAFENQGIERNEAAFIVQTVLVDEYNSKIIKAVNAVDQIRIKNGWSRQETATKLTDKNIEEWEKLLDN